MKLPLLLAMLLGAHAAIAHAAKDPILGWMRCIDNTAKMFASRSHDDASAVGIAAYLTCGRAELATINGYDALGQNGAQITRRMEHEMQQRAIADVVFTRMNWPLPLH